MNTKQDTPRQKKTAAAPADQAKAVPFAYEPKSEVDSLVDAFLEAKGPEFRAQIDATPKDFFVRKWALRLARRDQKIKDYYTSVERTLNQPEHEQLKAALQGKFGKYNVNEEVKTRLVLKEAGQRFKTDGVELVIPKAPPPLPRMTQ